MILTRGYLRSILQCAFAIITYAGADLHAATITKTTGGT